MDKGLLNNRYRLVELVGSGGMAVVYKGMDTLLHRPVAIKILREAYAEDATFLGRFQQEARSAARLDHPNVVTVYDVGQDGNRHYIIMEYVDGEDLKTLIRREGRLGVERAVNIAMQIAAGVGHAHQAGIIHCDVKPQNVLLTSDGRVKVTDFGIARALSESGLTDSDVVWGSPLYFSPEQAAGERPTPASDVYSIGVVLYEMLAGAPPFQAEKATALALMHIREDPPLLSVHTHHVPPQLEWIVRKVLAKEPSARYRTANQLAMILQEYQRQGNQATGLLQVPAGQDAALYYVPAEPSPPPAPVESASGPDWLTWILAAVAFIAVVGLIPLWSGVYLTWTRASATPVPPPLETPVPTVALVAVPNVAGRLWEEARTDLEAVGLRFALEEDQESTEPEGTILQQTPGAGEVIPVGTEVRLRIAGPPQTVETPGVVDVPVEMARTWLEQTGLQVVEQIVWSTAPISTVIAQAPERGTVLQAGDVVTLTVSGGTSVHIVIDANLANLILLEQADIPQASLRPGDIFAVSLRWKAIARIDEQYVVFVHIIGSTGNLVAQDDGQPLQGTQPTNTWATGSSLWDLHQITLPQNVPAGTYQVRAGMYPPSHPESRLPVVDPGAASVESNSILIAEIEITRP
ncbi:MAG: Stk1 family PASTA domain-containing Ser/Thr kinase [Anaerolineae bacterium]|nr:Stk1 family PASTA domain-containing Ser/Thr kinase [Anaerolineae bacterium]